MRGSKPVAAVLAVIAIALIATNCGKRRTQDGGGGNAAGAPLNIEIQSADVPASGAPSVTFRLTDSAGKPIDDLAAEIANDAAQVQQGQARPTPRMTPHFTLAQLEPSGTYTNYYEVTVQAQPFTVPGPQPQSVTPTGSAVQPRTEPPGGPFPVGNLEAQGNGVYRYTFSAPTTPPGKLDRALTHTVGMYATRTSAGQAGDEATAAHATFNFVPAGGAATTYQPVTDEACNACHGVLEAHDRRTGTQLCITCHAADRADPYADPESGNTIDFQVMVHKIHRGENLPSVKNGSPYRIIGFRQSVQDFSDVAFPRDVRECSVCHQGQNAQDRLARPSLAACTSCHDNVVFDGTAAASCAPGAATPCNHKGGPVGTAAICSACHTPGEIASMHVVAEDQALANFRFLIQGVTFDANRVPTVAVQVVNPQTGTPYQLVGTPDEPWTHGADSRLFVDIGWPSLSYSNAGSGAAFGQPVQIDVLKSGQPVAGQAGIFQVTSPVPVPADVDQITVVLEGHPAAANPTAPGTFVRVPVPNALQYAAVSGGAAQQRREVVSVDKCNSCHGVLSAHGNNRTGDTRVCVVCHNPDATDKGRRGPPANIAGEQSIDFKVLIHEVHGADIRQEPVEIIGFGGSRNAFPITFPGQSNNCTLCHVDSTFQLPISPDSRDTTVDSGADPKDPADDTRVGGTTAACTACHDVVRFDGSGAQSCGPNVKGPCNHRGGPVTSDASCTGCHGPGQTADVAKEHGVQ